MRREARQRREYLFRKAQEEKLQAVEEKKEKIKKALEGNKKLASDFKTCVCLVGGGLIASTYMQEFAMELASVDTGEVITLGPPLPDT